MTLSPARHKAPAVLAATPRRGSNPSLPTHARIVAPGQERAWPEFPAGGADPDFPGSDRPRRPSRLNGVVDGLLRFVRN